MKKRKTNLGQYQEQDAKYSMENEKQNTQQYTAEHLLQTTTQYLHP